MSNINKAFGVPVFFLVLQVIAPVSLSGVTLFGSVAHAGESRICLSKNAQFIIETNKGENCDKLFFHKESGNETFMFKAKTHYCKQVSKWKKTHSFSRLSKSKSKYSICKGMAKVKLEKSRYSRDFRSNTFTNKCRLPSSTSKSCKDYIRPYKQAVDNVYDRITGKEIKVSSSCKNCLGLD